MNVRLKKFLKDFGLTLLGVGLIFSIAIPPLFFVLLVVLVLIAPATGTK